MRLGYSVRLSLALAASFAAMFGVASLTLAAPPAPALIPSTATAGGAAFDLSVRVAMEDLPPSESPLSSEATSYAVIWGSKTLAATRTTTPGSADFIARISKKKLDVAGPVTRTVRAAYCKADGTCTAIGGTAEFVIARVPPPAITRLAPQKLTAGGPATDIEIRGARFRRSSVVRIGGIARRTTFVQPGLLIARVAAADISTAGSVDVRVNNPLALGGPSPKVQLTVTAVTPQPSTAPTISGISPASVRAGASAIDLTVTGSGFNSGSRVRFDGALRSTTFVSATKLVARIPAAALATAGPELVSVVATSGRASGKRTFQVLAGPKIQSLSPGSVLADGGSYLLTVVGSGFSESSEIQIDGKAVPTTRMGTSELRTLLGPSLLKIPGALAVRVVNPSDEGGASSATTLVVELAPEPVVPAVPEAPPEIGDLDAADPLPGEVLSIAGVHFGREQGQSTLTLAGEAVELAGDWGDARIEFRVPDLPPGVAALVLETVEGRAESSVTIAAPPEAPPIANPVLISGRDGRVTFDASIAIDPASGASAGDSVANAAGLSGISSVLWEFGDGRTSTATAPTASYSSPGTYRPRVTVTTTDGRSSTTATGTVRVTRSSSGSLAVAPPPVNFSLPSRVAFDAGGNTLRPESRSYLLKLADLVRRVGRRTEVGGHSDSDGSFSTNQQLSTERARAVRTFLVKEGKVPEGLLTAVGYGETRPVGGNDTPLGRQRNRRVELRIDRGDTPIRLTSRQLLINQRISQAAISRATALEKRLTTGLLTADIRNGSIMPQDFGPSVTVTGEPALGASAADRIRPLVVSRPKRTGKRLTVGGKQLLINQRISQAAVRRVNRLDAVLEAGLTGAVIRNGEVTDEDLAPRITVAAADGQTTTQGTFALPALEAPKKAGGTVRATQEQLIINQRVSQAAIRRLNLAIARFEKGLTGSDFRDGSLGSPDLAR